MHRGERQMITGNMLYVCVNVCRCDSRKKDLSGGKSVG